MRVAGDNELGACGQCSVIAVDVCCFVELFVFQFECYGGDIVWKLELLIKSGVGC